MDSSLQGHRPFKPRKAHTKSRNGCKYCRRRRIKCDEARPSCSQCAKRNQPCEYHDVSHHDVQHEDHQHVHSGELEFSCPSSLADTSTSISVQGPFSNVMDMTTSTPPLSASSFDHVTTSAYYDSGSVAMMSSEQHEVRHDAEDATALSATSDAMSEFAMSITKDLFLFDHYLNHACRSLDPMSGYGRKIGLPRLAAENQGVLCSILAMGAACLCIDLLLGQGTSDRAENVDNLIKTGDHYHQIGLQTVRHQIALNQPKGITEAYAHSVLLFPYAMAQKRISDLLGSLDPSRPLTGTELPIECPGRLDWTIVLRGISTTGRAYWAADSNGMDGVINDTMDYQPQKTHPSIASHILAKISEPGYQEVSSESDPLCCIASKHVLFPVVSATRVAALNSLQHKLENLDRAMRERHRKGVPTMDGDRVSIRLAQTQSLTACSIAIDLLVDLGKIIFDLEQVDDRLQPPVSGSIETPPEDSSLSWLRTYAKRGVYDHTIPAYRTIFAWVSTTPDEYFDLLKEPVATQESYRAAASAEKKPAELWDIDREIRLLAWDIWAHWLVFAILVEYEVFWAPNLGIPTITMLVPLFQVSIPELNLGSATAERQDWWPGNMCSVALQLQKYHNPLRPNQSNMT